MPRYLGHSPSWQCMSRARDRQGWQVLAITAWWRDNDRSSCRTFVTTAVLQQGMWCYYNDDSRISCMKRVSGTYQPEQVTSLPKVIWEDGRVAAKVKTLLITMAPPTFRPKCTPSRRPIPNPHCLPHPWTVWPIMPNGIQIRSAVFPQCTGQTDRSSTGKFDGYRPLSPNHIRPTSW